MITLAEVLRDATRMRSVYRARERAARHPALGGVFGWILFAAILAATYAQAQSIWQVDVPYEFSWGVVLALWLVAISLGDGSRCLEWNDFERLHAPVAGLVVYRWFRLSALWLSVGACFALLLGLAWLTHAEDRALASLPLQAWLMVPVALLLPFLMNSSHVCRNAWIGLGVQTLVFVPFIVALPGFTNGTLGVCVSILCCLGCVAAIVEAWRGLATLEQRRTPTQEEDEEEQAPVRAALYAADESLAWNRDEPRRSLLANSWCLAVANRRLWPRVIRHAPVAAVLGFGFAGFVHTIPYILAQLAVFRSEQSVSLVWPVLAGLITPCWLAVGEREHIYLWGVDLREMERHDIFARAVTVAMPVCALAVLAAWLFGATTAGWGAIGLVAACQIARLGLGGAHSDQATAWILLSVAAAVVATPWVGSCSVQMALALAGVVSAIGAIGIVVRLVRPEATLRSREFV